MRTLIISLLCLAVTFAMIVLPPGYKGASRDWPELINKAVEEVKAAISKDMKNIQFKIFTEAEYKMYPEEFWYNKVRLVVDNNNVVVVVPSFFGTEPDFSLVPNLVGQKYKAALDNIKTVMPELKVVVMKNGQSIYATSDKNVDYAKLEVDDADKIVKEPEYLRVVAEAE